MPPQRDRSNVIASSGIELGCMFGLIHLPSMRGSTIGFSRSPIRVEWTNARDGPAAGETTGDTYCQGQTPGRQRCASHGVSFYGTTTVCGGVVALAPHALAA